MPVYEYKCLQCDEQFEVMQKMSEDPLRKCRLCGGELKKLIANTSFVLKGGGWYVTDYPSAERKKAMESKKSSASDKGAKSEKKADSEKKTDTKKKAVNA